VALGLVALDAMRHSGIVEKPGGDRQERNLARAEEDVAELSGFRVTDREVVFEQLYQTE